MEQCQFFWVLKNVEIEREQGMAIYSLLFALPTSPYVVGCLDCIWHVWPDQTFLVLGSNICIRKWFGWAVHSATRWDAARALHPASAAHAWLDIWAEGGSAAGFGTGSIHETWRVTATAGLGCRQISHFTSAKISLHLEESQAPGRESRGWDTAAHQNGLETNVVYPQLWELNSMGCNWILCQTHGAQFFSLDISVFTYTGDQRSTWSCADSSGFW